MYAQISTVAFAGIEAKAVEVQVRITPGQQTFAIVGLPDKAVAESRERVRNALHAVGLGLPFKHLTVNLAPADLPKEGSHFDLPIVLCVMAAMGALDAGVLSGFAAIGELALDGAIRDVPGVLPAAMGANAMGKGLICPAGGGSEAAWASEEMDILAPSHLLALVNHFKGTQVLARPEPELARVVSSSAADMADIKGQESAKRALEVCAAGGHNLLMVGPPGCGKSMLAERLPSILPPLEPAEMLEVSMVHSLAGELLGGKLALERPFRSPHHSASMPSLVGGGSRPVPGEVSLAHLGVLFLDELPEFTPQVLDSLRQPLESGEIVITRANHRVRFPSRIQLVAAMNPCRCGGGTGQSCKRGPRCASDYQARISGPLLDRFDLQIELPAVMASDLVAAPSGEASEMVRNRVVQARARQTKRFSELGADRVRSNSECSGQLLDKAVQLDEEGEQLLRSAGDQLGLTARGVHRTMRVARTLADLEGVELVTRTHVAEALSYRAETLGQRQAA